VKVYVEQKMAYEDCKAGHGETLKDINKLKEVFRLVPDWYVLLVHH
jgi:hypothetical protein